MCHGSCAVHSGSLSGAHPHVAFPPPCGPKLPILCAASMQDASQTTAGSSKHAAAAADWDRLFKNLALNEAHSQRSNPVYGMASTAWHLRNSSTSGTLSRSKSVAGHERGTQAGGNTAPVVGPQPGASLHQGEPATVLSSLLCVRLSCVSMQSILWQRHISIWAVTFWPSMCSMCMALGQLPRLKPQNGAHDS